MRRSTTLWVLICLLFSADLAAADPVVLRLLHGPHDGLVIARVDPAGGLGAPTEGDHPVALQAVTLSDQRVVPAQFIPDPSYSTGLSAPSDSPRGMVMLQLPTGTSDAVRLRVDDRVVNADSTFDGTVTRPGYLIEHRATAMGGLPSRIRFPVSGKDFSQFAWNDRVHHPELGGFLLRYDQHAQVDLLSEGPICSVVRVQAAYTRPDGTQPPSHPRAVYQWHYLHALPLVFVTATITQDEPFPWQEVHFLELNFPGRDFDRWVGDGPAEQGDLLGDNASHRFQNWAGVVDQQNGIGMFGCRRVLVHDGRGGYGTYLHADGDRAWQPWDDTQRTHCAWLWMGTHDQPATLIGSWQQRYPATVSAVLSPEPVHRAIAAAREQVPHDDAARTDHARHVAWAARLEMAGRFAEALAALQGNLPADWTSLSAGDLQLVLQQADGGVQLQSLCDSRWGHEHAPASPPPALPHHAAPCVERRTADPGGGPGVGRGAAAGSRHASVGDALAASGRRRPG